jgi:hypothetical protein
MQQNASILSTYFVPLPITDGPLFRVDSQPSLAISNPTEICEQANKVDAHQKSAGGPVFQSVNLVSNSHNVLLTLHHSDAKQALASQQPIRDYEFTPQITSFL